jgi:phosphoglycolate phosphatase
MKIKKTYFVFDLDDTLVDSYEYNQQMFVDTFAPYLGGSLNENEKYLRELHFESKGKSMFEQFDKAINNLELNTTPEQLVKENENLHKRCITTISLFASVVDVIKSLRARGADIAILSNRQTESLNKLIEKEKIKSSLTKVVSCTDEGYEKPDPYCLNMLVMESGKDKSEFLYFGDSKTDAEFANAAGIDCIIVDQYVNNKSFFKIFSTFLF